MKRLFRNRFGRTGIDRDVDDELRHHLELRVASLMARGVDEAEAWRRARARFGDEDTIRGECRAIQTRRRGRMRRADVWDEIRQDLKFGVRGLLRRPLFAVIALATLAIGMGGTTAVFSIVNSVLLRPFPFDGHDRVHFVTGFSGTDDESLNAPTIDAWRRSATRWDRIAAFRPDRATLRVDELPRLARGWRITHEFFGLVSASMTLGGGWSAEADRPGSDDVVVVTHGLWARDLGADPDAIGRRIELDGERLRVVGVLGPEFDMSADLPEYFRPLALTPEEWAHRGGYYLTALGRMAPGVDRATALAELRALGEVPSEKSPFRIEATTVAERITDPIRAPLLLMLGAVGMVLAIGCVNVANLLLAQGSRRAKELAVRAAVGAGRGRVVRQLLVESALLGLFGALLALPVAALALETLVRLAPADVPRLADAALDPASLLFTVALGLGTALVFGLAPAWRAGRTDPGRTLKDGNPSVFGGRRDGVRHGLVAAEVALCVTLLVSAGLLLRSASNLSSIERGFEEDVLTGQVSLPWALFPNVSDAIDGFAEIRARFSALPGVTAAAYTSRAPLAGNSFGLPVVRTGDEALVDSDGGVSTAMRIASPGYFDAMGIPRVAGRVPDATDDVVDGATVVINDVLARRLGIDEDPIGARITAVGSDFRRADGEYRSWEVIGVVRTTVDWSLRDAAGPEMFMTPRAVPPGPWDWIGREMMLVLRTSTDPAALVSPLRRVVAEVNPSLPLYDVRTMRQRVSESLALDRMVRILLSGLGALAVLLAAGGIFAVVSFLVGRRVREMGLRMALGASASGLRVLVVRQSLPAVGVGLLIGIGLAITVSRRLGGLLYGVTPGDLPTLAIASALVTSVAVLAAWIPARRASTVDPVGALTSD